MRTIGRGTCMMGAGLFVVALAAACGEVAGVTELVPLPAALSDSVRSGYHEDAVRLVARADGAGGPVRPSASAVATLETALLRVYASSLPAADSVTVLHAIHSSNPPTHEVLVTLVAGNRWADAWRAGQALTGEPAVDSLVRAYDLSVAQYYAWSIGDAAVLRSAEPVNTPALARVLGSAPGVRYAEPNTWIGGSVDIRAQVEVRTVLLDYSLAWGDCMAGCINAHVWHFRVTDGGAVTYLGSSGPELPR